MATITIKEIEDELVSRLKSIAKKNRRSLNQEVIYLLERRIEEEGPISAEAMIELRDKLDIKPKRILSPEEIEMAINIGREC